MPARFAETRKAIEAGLKDMAITKAIRNIEGWEAHLQTLEVSGAKGLHGDLGRLKRLLQAEPIDPDAVKALIGKMAEATLRIAGRTEGKRAADVEALGKALQSAG